MLKYNIPAPYNKLLVTFVKNLSKANATQILNDNPECSKYFMGEKARFDNENYQIDDMGLIKNFISVLRIQCSIATPMYKQNRILPILYQFYKNNQDDEIKILYDVFYYILKSGNYVILTSFITAFEKETKFFRNFVTACKKPEFFIGKRSQKTLDQLLLLNDWPVKSQQFFLNKNLKALFTEKNNDTDSSLTQPETITNNLANDTYQNKDKNSESSIEDVYSNIKNFIKSKKFTLLLVTQFKKRSPHSYDFFVGKTIYFNNIEYKISDQDLLNHYRIALNAHANILIPDLTPPNNLRVSDIFKKYYNEEQYTIIYEFFCYLLKITSSNKAEYFQNFLSNLTSEINQQHKIIQNFQTFYEKKEIFSNFSKIKTQLNTWELDKLFKDIPYPISETNDSSQIAGVETNNTPSGSAFINEYAIESILPDKPENSGEFSTSQNNFSDAVTINPKNTHWKQYSEQNIVDKRETGSFYSRNSIRFTGWGVICY